MCGMYRRMFSGFSPAAAATRMRSGLLLLIAALTLAACASSQTAQQTQQAQQAAQAAAAAQAEQDRIAQEQAAAQAEQDRIAQEQAAAQAEQERIVQEQAAQVERDRLAQEQAAARAEATLAVLPFTGGSDEDGETIAELFSFQKELNSAFTLVPRTSINRAITSEQGFQMTSGMTDPDTIAALGKQLGAKYVLAGAITKLGDQNLLVIAILHTEDLRQIAGHIQTYETIEEIDGKLPAIAHNIAAALKIDGSNLPLLAVLPVRLSGGADEKEADTLAQILAVHLVQSGKYAVYPRTKSLEQVQDEYKNQFNGDVADEYLPHIGMGTNPRLVLSVTTRRLGRLNKFNAAVINLETGVQETGEAVDYESLADGMQVMEELALRLSGQENVLVQREAERALYNPVVGTQSAFAQAVAAINSDKAGGTYTITLNGNFVSNPVGFTGDVRKTITLKGDGTTRAIANNADKALFALSAGITLILENGVTLNGNGKEAPLVDVQGGTLRMNSGSTVRSAQSCGVFVPGGGTFMMTGGEISGNTGYSSGSSRYGGGVYVDGGGTFTMSGGTISGNSAANSGGGVFVNSSGTFTMSGGTISNNTASYGGGVYMNSSGTFTMSGGTISGNSAANYGGGVRVNSGTFTMSGGTISGNSASDSGGGVGVNSGTFTMSGGTISGNSAANSGGGVYVNSGTFTKSGGGTIDATNSAPAGKVAYVYVNESTYRVRNSAAGPSVYMDNRVSGSAGGWE